MDFALILVVATGVTGLIWLGDILLLQKSRQTRVASGEIANEPVIVEYARSFFPVLLLVLLLRSFLFEPFRIPSGSMMPTLLTGDFIFVNKFAYGLRLPVINTRIVEIGEPERGDVVVFRLPREPSVNYIKRIVGLPGDQVFYDDRRKQITVNGITMEIERVGVYTEDESYDLAREVLGDKEHFVLWNPATKSIGGTYNVPEGMYFMMGDNRDNSEDSRFDMVGFVPEGNLVGRASRIWLSWSGFGEGVMRWTRIGQGID